MNEKKERERESQKKIFGKFSLVLACAGNICKQVNESQRGEQQNDASGLLNEA